MGICMSSSGWSSWLQWKIRMSTPHYYTTLHDITLHYTALITPHCGYNCNCTCQWINYTTLQLQLHHTTLQLRLQLQLQLHYTTLHPAVAVRWPLLPLQPFQKTQLQPPVGPSVDSLCHPWFTTTSLSYRFPIFGTSATALCGTTGSFIFEPIDHTKVVLSLFQIISWILNPIK